MRPIDKIKQSIDSDLVKYHGASLCFIESEDHVKDISGVGLCAVVRPYNLLDPEGAVPSGPDSAFPILIVNRPKGWMESNISGKYFVVVLSQVSDRPAVSLGCLVPKTVIKDLQIFKDSVDQRTAVNTEKKSIEAFTKDNTPDAKSH